jgi:phosphate transport system substrate-binding protein
MDDTNRLSRRELILATLAALGSVAHAAARPSHLTLTGSSTVAPLALEIAKRFEKLHPDVRVDVQSGGSSRGVIDARSGRADIGMVSRALSAQEADLTAHRIAMDGVCIILHDSNPVGRLSSEQVKAIYTGRLLNWQVLGGPDLPITVVSKAEGRSTLELFLQHFGLRNSEVRAQAVIGDNQQGIKTVAANVGAIGYVSIGTADFEATHGARIKLLPLDGVPATVAMVRSGAFPLSRPLNLVTRGPATGWAQAFIAFAQSAAVQDLVAQQFFVSVARP